MTATRTPGLACTVALCLGLLACGRAPAPREAAGARRAAPAAAAARPASRPQTPSPVRPAAEAGFLGVLLAREAVDLSAEASGRLTAVHVRAGDRVARGALVATVDTESLGQDLEAARAVLRQAEIEAEKSVISLADAEGRLARRQSFPEAFPKEEIVAAENQRAAAKAAVEGAKARVREQRVRVAQLAGTVARAEVRAPFAGTIGVRYQEAGAVVGPGVPIVRLVGSGDLLVRFAIPEGEVRTVEPGRAVTVAVRGTRLALAGVVEKIAPEVDPASGMVLAEARIEAGEPAGTVQPGAVVRVVPRHGREAE